MLGDNLKMTRPDILKTMLWLGQDASAGFTTQGRTERINNCGQYVFAHDFMAIHRLSYGRQMGHTKTVLEYAAGDYDNIRVFGFAPDREIFKDMYDDTNVRPAKELFNGCSSSGVHFVVIDAQGQSFEDQMIKYHDGPNTSIRQFFAERFPECIAVFILGE